MEIKKIKYPSVFLNPRTSQVELFFAKIRPEFKIFNKSYSSIKRLNRDYFHRDKKIKFKSVYLKTRFAIVWFNTQAMAMFINIFKIT
jgi:hypothetical protein